jgi:hypothetical protein
MNQLNSAQSTKMSGGIQWWVDHPLLSQDQLPAILQEIEPSADNCLRRVLAWPEDPRMQANWQALSDLVASKMPDDIPIDDAGKQELILRKIRDSITIFAKPHPDLGQQSLQAYVKDIVNDLGGSRFSMGSAIGQSLCRTIAWSLFLQDVADNPRYTPHDYRHALVTARWMATLAQAEPTLLNRFSQRYQCTNAQALALMQLVGLMHDCGYPFMAAGVEPSGEVGRQCGCHETDQPRAPQLTKATHAVVGGLMFHVLVQPALTQLFKSGGVDQGEAICREMGRAIHLHSSDSPTQSGVDKLQVSTVGGAIFQVSDISQLKDLAARLAVMGDPVVRVKLHAPTPEQLAELQNNLPEGAEITIVSEPMTPGRSLDLEQVGDKALATPCVKVDRREIPLAYLLMLADNLDITQARLGSVQGSSVYGRSLLQFHDAPDLKAGLQTLRTVIQALYANRPLCEDATNWPDDPEQVLLNVCASSPKDIYYLAGLLAVADVSIEPLGQAAPSVLGSEQSDSLKIVVELKPLPAWMRAQQLPVEAVKKQMVFHVDRLQTALNFLVDAPTVEVRWPDRLFAPEWSPAQMSQRKVAAGENRA